MNISMFAKLTGHMHFKFEVPALAGFLGENAEAEIDIVMVDRDKDGDPEIEVKWDLPGTAFDSGSEPRIVEIPVSVLLGPVGGVVEHALGATGAPKLLVGIIGKMFKR